MDVTMTAIGGVILLSSTCLSYVVSKGIEPLIQRRWGHAIYESSFYLQQITGVAFVLTSLISNFILFTLTGQLHFKYIISLCTTLVYGYYITFNSVIFTIFERKYHNLLLTRYKIEPKTTLDEALISNQNGSIAYHVAFLVTGQLNKARKVVFPLGSLFLIIAVLGVSYVPLICIQSLLYGGLLGVFLSLLPWVYLLPDISISAPKVNSLRLTLIRISPVLIFPFFFIATSSYLVDVISEGKSSEFFVSML